MAICTAQVLLHRFFYRRSMAKFSVEVCPAEPVSDLEDAADRAAGRSAPARADAQSVAMASIYLASKIEECPRRARDVVNVAHYIGVTRQGLPYEPMDVYGGVRGRPARPASAGGG